MKKCTLPLLALLFFAAVAIGDEPKTKVDFSTLKKAYPALKAMADEINEAYLDGNKLKWKLLTKNANEHLSSMEGKKVKWDVLVSEVTESEVLLRTPGGTEQNSFRIVGPIEDDTSTNGKKLSLLVGDNIPLAVAVELKSSQSISIEATIKRISFRGSNFWIELVGLKYAK